MVLSCYGYEMLHPLLRVRPFHITSNLYFLIIPPYKSSPYFKLVVYYSYIVIYCISREVFLHTLYHLK